MKVFRKYPRPALKKRIIFSARLKRYLLAGSHWSFSSDLLSLRRKYIYFLSKLQHNFTQTTFLSFQFEFILSFLNIIDLLGILPFFVSLILNQLSSQYSLEYIAKAAQIFRILRILRIFKLSRHITGLKTLGTTLRNSHRELLLLSMTVSMGMLIFAGLGYALEKDEPDTMFYTLPQTLYWAIITMTSTGYGDISPRTSAGKLVASLCAICGVLCITLPIPIIVANFNRSSSQLC